MPKNVKIWLLVMVSILVLSLVFSAGCLFTLNATQKTGLNVTLLNQAWNIIQTNYVTPAAADDATLNRGAIRGMVQSINDPYSYYLNPDEYRMTQENFRSSFGGIGATISMNDKKQPVIVQTIKGSPAEKAGLKGEDAILAVDNFSTEGLSVEQVVSRVRGQIGTAVILTILRKDATTPEDISIVRAEINPITVSSRMIDNVAYIQITNFYERTGDEFQNALNSLDLKNSRGIIIDLRNNLGGFVSSMVDVASHFIKEGPIITLRDNQGRKDTKSVDRRGTLIELPVVVLVNQYSASASEVLSGAFQDYGRATIAGVKTLGKGSYDQFFQLEDGSAIYLTVGRWLTPKEREIEGQGITPDYILTETGEDTINWAVNYLKSR
ncbi:MAG TPA: S41 family peptidase [Dehalococcoidales bacterium]|nr:S41 family peptidase [Dehalococcoidales bacterium]